MNMFEPISEVSRVLPFEEIAMIMITDEQGRRPLNERERLEVVAAWGYRLALSDKEVFEREDHKKPVFTDDTGYVILAQQTQL